MLEQNIFLLAFLGQVLVISVYFPHRIARRMSFVLENYPPATHPLLYPKPLAHYERKRRTYQIANRVIALAGLAALYWMFVESRGTDSENRIVFFYFLLQVFPMLWIEAQLRREVKLMRTIDTATTRTAELNPRRLFDFISPTLFWSVVVVYVGFWFFIAWFRQFDYQWFGGFLNNAIITGLNVFFAAIILWHMYGKKRTPHQTQEDRNRHIRNIATALALTSIAVTLYAVVSIYLSAEDARHLQPLGRTLYFQLIIFLSYQTYQIKGINFEVYRGRARAT